LIPALPLLSPGEQGQVGREILKQMARPVSGGRKNHRDSQKLLQIRGEGKFKDEDDRKKDLTK